MCNRVVQKEKIIKPGERVMVLLKGPGATFELPFEGAVFARPAKKESRNYWMDRGALEWVIDQYRVTSNDYGHISSDPNRDDDEQYIVRLLGQVIMVSLETMKVVKGLPGIYFE